MSPDTFVSFSQTYKLKKVPKQQFYYVDLINPQKKFPDPNLYIFIKYAKMHMITQKQIL